MAMCNIAGEGTQFSLGLGGGGSTETFKMMLCDVRDAARPCWRVYVCVYTVTI